MRQRRPGTVHAPMHRLALGLAAAVALVGAAGCGEDREKIFHADAPPVVDVLVESAYREGKLQRSRDALGEIHPSPHEAWLRRVGLTEGVQALKDEIASMPKISSVNERVMA